MIELDTIYNEDCLTGMQRIPDGSVDCIICDLPYEVLNKGNANAQWDRLIPMEPLWEQYHRVCKPNAPIVLFAGEPFTSLLIMSNLSEYRQKLFPSVRLYANKVYSVRRGYFLSEAFRSIQIPPASGRILRKGEGR